MHGTPVRLVTLFCRRALASDEADFVSVTEEVSVFSHFPHVQEMGGLLREAY